MRADRQGWQQVLRVRLQRWHPRDPRPIRQGASRGEQRLGGLSDAP